MALGLCGGCKRFARGEICPFCRHTVTPNPWRPALRLSRAAAIAVALGGCSSSLPTPPADPIPIPAPTPMYGAAPPPSVIAPDPEPVPTVAPMYGLAPRIER